MRVEWRSQIPVLRKAQTEGCFAEFKRKPMSHYPVAGYLIELAKDCLVIREFNWDTFAWNGTCIIRARDVAGVRIFEKHEWPMVAGKELRLVIKTGLNVTSDTFRSVTERHLCEGDLVQIEQEKIHPGDMFLCQVVQLSRNAIQTKSYDRDLQSFEKVEMLYRNITKLSFGDGYSKAARIAQKTAEKIHGPNKK